MRNENRAGFEKRDRTMTMASAAGEFSGGNMMDKRDG
jgi:hypothetical protein